MSEAIVNNEPAIKLFGHTIQFPHFPAPALPGDYSSSAGIDEHELKDQDQCDDCKDENEPLTAEELEEQNPIPEKSDIINKSPDNDCSMVLPSKTEDGQDETCNSQERILKKPDKILPCPRCNSMETKFCYFNNYNVSQPRHFCKNCQRYWTAGGTMRNVPVGAGRRKNKNGVIHYPHVSMYETVPNARTDLLNGTQQPSLKLNGTILTFDTDKPLCESISSFSNIGDKPIQNCSGNGFHKYEDRRIPVAYEAGDNGDDHSEGSSVTAVSSRDSVNKGGLPNMLRQNCNNYPPNVPCFTGAPWLYPWSNVHWNNAVPPPAYCLPGFPMPFYPAATYWGPTIPGSWNSPWPLAASQDQMPPTSDHNSLTLGKHSRDETLLESMGSVEEPREVDNPEKYLWFPKTLRIGDPGNAAKSSIWKTLGIKHDTIDSVSGGFLKAFLPESGKGNHLSENSTLLQANPAAMSRSLNFNEST